jgi:hypothetical protein
MQHTILFTGHMIDAPGRKNPRFPPEKESAVKSAIRSLLIDMQSTVKEKAAGIAGGACGGDLLFHEQCAELGIPTEMYLALPVADFMKQSVSFAGELWEGRFKKLITQVPIHILPKSEKGGQEENVWERSNLWMLKTSLKHGGKQMTLMALWDGKEGDCDGGTRHMIATARDKDAEIKIIQINKLQTHGS